MALLPCKPVGGLRRVVLCPLGEIEEISLAEGVCQGILLREGASPIEVPLHETGSHCEEEISLPEGLPLRSHTLTLVTDRRRGRDLFNEKFLHRALHEGFVARVEYIDGEERLLGWSRRLEGASPLRLKRLLHTSGSRRGDWPLSTLTLQCEDTESPLLFNTETDENS